MKLYPGSVILLCIRASALSERDVVCREVEQLLMREENALTIDPALALTTFYPCHVSTRCHMLDRRWCKVNGHNLTLGGRRFVFGYSLSRHRNAGMGLPTPRLIMVFCFLLLNFTVSCEPTNVIEATYQTAAINSTQTQTQLYYDTFAAEQLNSWIAKYSSIT